MAKGKAEVDRRFVGRTKTANMFSTFRMRFIASAAVVLLIAFSPKNRLVVVVESFVLPRTTTTSYSSTRTSSNDSSFGPLQASSSPSFPTGERLFSNSVYETIQNGQIAVLPNFLSAAEVAPLKRDAAALHAAGHFSTDALASYGTQGAFDPTKDRAVLKLAQWKDASLGSMETRKEFASKMQHVRTDLATHLNRPRLAQGLSVSKYGVGSTEISYTRFGPGAFLARHVDEHHEELKGPAGWSKPTRRSLSWLVYLNDRDWNANKHGGCLRCYQRAAVPPSHTVGARRDGDLQIGWLRPTAADPVERPVFLDAQRLASGGAGGTCAMYVDSDNDSDSSDGGVQYISTNFQAHPTLFVAGSELLAQRLLLTRDDLRPRFHFIEPPKSVVTDWLNNNNNQKMTAADEVIRDVEPAGGTLVVFDSVSLPHQVLATVGRERWATSGWFHEDQQPIETHPHFQQQQQIV